MYLKFETSSDFRISFVREIKFPLGQDRIEVKCDLGILVMVYGTSKIQVSSVDFIDLSKLERGIDYEVFHYGDKI